MTQGQYTPPPLTRRQAIAGGLSLGVGILAAGCGGTSKPSSSSSSSSAAAPPAGPRKRGGTFRWGGSESSASATVDPAKMLTEDDYAVGHTLYDRLVEFDADMHPTMTGLAEEFSPSADAQTWTLRLRKGLTFHDGKPVTVDDVIFSINRMLAATGSLSQASVNSVNPKLFKKLDPLTLRIGLSYANSFLLNGFAHSSTGIVPVGFDPKRPVGTGPFKFVSFSPGQLYVAQRNPNYWISGLPYLDEIRQIGFADAVVARFNALQSGQIDGMPALDFSQVSVAKANSTLSLIESHTGAYSPITMRVDTPPFTDKRVVDAFKLIPDRPQLVSQAYSGYGRVANDLGWPQDPGFDSSLPQRVQDIAKAKSLLKAAGHESLNLTFVVQAGGVNEANAAQVFAEQAKAAGVNIQVTVPNVTTYFAKDYLKATLSNEIYNTDPLSTTFNFSLLPTSPYNESHWNEPRAGVLFKQAQASVDEAKRKPILDELQTLVWQDSGWIVWGYRDYFDVITTKFTGVSADASGIGLNGGRIKEISLA